MKKTKSSAPSVLAPVALDVEIVGDVNVGSTVRGFYTYDSQGGDPEGLSLFYWHINGERLTDEGQLDFKLQSADADKQLQFSVIPVNSVGEQGPEVFSKAYLISSGFQGISDEENEWCYLKQRGNFSFHIPEPSDRIFVSTGGVFALLHPPTGDIHLEGQTGWGLPVPPEIINFLKNNKAVKLFSSEVSFAALVPVATSNQLLCWGNTVPANLPPLQGVKSVYSTRSAFAFIYENPADGENRIGAIGLLNNPAATVPDDIQLALWFDPPAAIYTADDAFAVRTERGKVYAWGQPNNGGSIPADVRAQLDNMFITRIVASAVSFCAIDEFGDIAVWGQATGGGTIPPDRLQRILDDGGVQSVIAATAAFCAITRDKRRAVSWGRAVEGGDMHASAQALATRGNIVICKAARWAFIMANESGQAQAWGAPLYGGAPLPAKAKREYKAALQAAQPSPGYPPRKGDKNNVQRRRRNVSSRVNTNDGYLNLYANDVSFFLLGRYHDGRTKSIVLTGYATHGGTMNTALYQTLMASLIRDVYCTNGAYGVITTQGGTEGAVSVWGATLAMEDAGEIPPELAEFLRSGVVELYSIKRFPYVTRPVPPPPPPPPPRPEPIDPSFAARRTDGTYVLWGGNVDNQHYDPSAK
ncbi:RCC1 domain-containing protein [Pseudomonas mucidolens]|uniref:Uncharacterized protein n=1 Tax=Pseudomonas mucidolens TaxID=46679 RepID=A0A1H2MMD1_9PSED|nr:hypothetical protein [Pseudomonas mucidolens]SDU94369.1 hypothetical protein SAMN05216202_2008 [Pseudomonas mucidolens]SQH33587.1 Uncharacterised protein [Pseudomonas mucidolens]